MLQMNTDVTPDSVEQELIALESVIGRLRARQVTLLRDADAMQIPTRDGCATLKEWVAGRLDLQPSTAAELAHMARSEPSAPEWDLEAGDISFDRAAATKSS